VLNRAQKLVLWGVLVWAALTCVLALSVRSAFRLDPQTPPPQALSAWVRQAMVAASNDERASDPPPDVAAYAAAGPVIVEGWNKGARVLRHVGSPSVAATMDEVGPSMRAAGKETHWTVTVPLAEGPLIRGVPWLSALNLVPMREGLVARMGSETRYLTPAELTATGRYDTGVVVRWIPDLSFGIDLEALVGELAEQLAVPSSALDDFGAVRRFSAVTVTEAPYPSRTPVTAETVRQAAVDAAEFLLRHQREDGVYTYLYDGHEARSRRARYNLPRHAGSTYFLAQMGHLGSMPEAREGAIKALTWLRKRRMRHCGAPSRWCVGASSDRRVAIGSSALTVVAAAEVLEAGDDPLARLMVVRLTDFLRSQQREDGELMHVYDFRKRKPVDVQYMYYSGEAAFALLKAYRVLGDERNLRAAERLMKHLTGAGWDFPGSRYHYGEEHWTCIAAGEARGLIDNTEALEFCRRWAHYGRVLQYDAGQTPWDSEGGYGVGPFLVPRLTPAGSRTEALVAIYQAAKERGAETGELRTLIERGLGFLLRWRWAPGPAYLLADPTAAYGAVPGTPVDAVVRNDYIQHAGSSWIRWASILQQEQGNTPED
jgi:hypothetical protein